MNQRNNRGITRLEYFIGRYSDLIVRIALFILLTLAVLSILTLSE